MHCRAKLEGQVREVKAKGERRMMTTTMMMTMTTTTTTATMTTTPAHILRTAMMRYVPKHCDGPFLQCRSLLAAHCMQQAERTLQSAYYIASSGCSGIW